MKIRYGKKIIDIFNEYLELEKNGNILTFNCGEKLKTDKIINYKGLNYLITENDNNYSYKALIHNKGFNCNSLVKFETVEKRLDEVIEIIKGTFLLDDKLRNNLDIKNTSDNSYRRTIRLENATLVDVLVDIEKKYCVKYRVESGNLLHIFSKSNVKNLFLNDNINVSNIDYKENSYNLYTAIRPIGKDGLNIKSVNNGSEIIENKKYSNKFRLYTWIDERYENVTNLKNDAIEKLKKLSSPQRTISATISININNDILPLDNIKLTSKKISGIFEVKKVIKNENKTIIEIGSTIKGITQSIQENIDNLKESSLNLKSEINENYFNKKDIKTLLVDYVATDYLKSRYTETNELVANYARIDSLNVLEGNIRHAIINNADVGNLKADIANIKGILSSVTTTSNNTTTFHLTAENAVIEDALINDAVMKNANIRELAAGSINTDLLSVTNNDNTLTIKNGTITITDKVRPRVQIGKDINNDYSLNVWDKEGNLIFDSNGLTTEGINKVKVPVLDYEVSGEYKPINNNGYKLTNLSEWAKDLSNKFYFNSIDTDKLRLEFGERITNFNSINEKLATLRTDVNGFKTTVTEHKMNIDTKLDELKNKTDLDIQTMASTIEQKVNEINMRVANNRGKYSEIKANVDEIRLFTRRLIDVIDIIDDDKGVKVGKDLFFKTTKPMKANTLYKIVFDFINTTNKPYIYGSKSNNREEQKKTLEEDNYAIFSYDDERSSVNLYPLDEVAVVSGAKLYELTPRETELTLNDYGAVISGDHIDLLGNATFTSLLDSTKTKIDGSKITTGSISAQQLSSDAINGKTIKGAKIYSPNIYFGDEQYNTTWLKETPSGIQIQARNNNPSRLDPLGNRDYGIAMQLSSWNREGTYFGVNNEVPPGLFIYKDTDFSIGGKTHHPTMESLMTVNGTINFFAPYDALDVKDTNHCYRFKTVGTNLIKNHPVDNTWEYPVSVLNMVNSNGKWQLHANNGFKGGTSDIWCLADRTYSDVRLKENIRDSEVNAIDIFDKLKFKSFSFIKKDETPVEEPFNVGLIAQDVENIMDDVVYEMGNYKHLDDFRLLMYTMKAVQELIKENKELRKEIENVKNQEINKTRGNDNGGGETS